MKIKNVFDEIFSMENLQGALEDASKGRRFQAEPLRYNLNAYELLSEIRDEIYNGTYHIDRYHVFYIFYVKFRLFFI